MPPFQPMLNFEHIIQSKNYIKSSKLSQKKYTTEPRKVHLNSDMETIRNHLIIKNIGQIQNVWKNNGDLKNLKHNLRYNFILRRCQPTKRTGICYLCLNKKLFVTEHQEGNLQNQKHELISKFRHKNKFKLMNHKTWPLFGKCPCLELFSGANFFPHLDWIWKLTE